jgi:hypothetical protein
MRTSIIIDGHISTHNIEEEAFDWVSPFIITTMQVSEPATTMSADFFSQNHNSCPSHGISYYYSPPCLWLKLSPAPWGNLRYAEHSVFGFFSAPLRYNVRIFQVPIRKPLYLLFRLQFIYPALIIWGFSTILFLRCEVCQPHAQPPTWSTRLFLFIWSLPIVTCPAWEALPVARLPPA